MCGQIHTNAVHECHKYKPQAGHNITIKGAKCMMTKKLFLSFHESKGVMLSVSFVRAKLILSFSETSLFTTLTVFPHDPNDDTTCICVPEFPSK